VLVKRKWEETKKREQHEHTRAFITSLPVDKARSIAKQVRGHWSVENKNHYRKDNCVWKEDKHRHRRTNAAQNLALMRSALLSIIPFDKDNTLDDLLDDYHAKPSLALKIIQKSRPI